MQLNVVQLLSLRIVRVTAWSLASMLALVGCSSKEGSGGGNFCATLNAASSCIGALESCQQQLAIDDLEYPECGAARSAFLGCLNRQDLICTGASTVYAGATENTGSPAYLGDYTAWYPPECDADFVAWTACRNCPKALERLGAVDLTYGDLEVQTRCASDRTAFLSCVQADEPLRCPDEGTLETAASSAASAVELSLDGVVVRTSSACAAAFDAWEGCVSCGGGIAYGKQGLDVGQTCNSTAECASGLTCVFNHCTAPCSIDAITDPCRGRNFVDGQCRNDDGRVTTCSNIVDACVVECDGDDDCTAIAPNGFCPGNGSILAPRPDSLVEYGYCFFGVCGEGWDGCTPERPFPQ